MISLSGILFLFQEAGLRKGGEPKYAHLSMELHVFIEVFAPVPDAYLRMAHAMEEVKKFLFPVSGLLVLRSVCVSSVGNCPLTCLHIHSVLCLACKEKVYTHALSLEDFSITA